MQIWVLSPAAWGIMVVINIIMNYCFSAVQEKAPGDIRNERVHTSRYFKLLSLCAAAVIHSDLFKQSIPGNKCLKPNEVNRNTITQRQSVSRDRWTISGPPCSYSACVYARAAHELIAQADLTRLRMSSPRHYRLKCFIGRQTPYSSPHPPPLRPSSPSTHSEAPRRPAWIRNLRRPAAKGRRCAGENL